MRGNFFLPMHLLQARVASTRGILLSFKVLFDCLLGRGSGIVVAPDDAELSQTDVTQPLEGFLTDKEKGTTQRSLTV